MADNIVVTFLVDQPEFYILEVSHFQGLLCGLMPEIVTGQRSLCYCTVDPRINGPLMYGFRK
jgi:hypothetical protein